MKKLLAFVGATLFATTLTARDYVHVAGSSTVLPYATIVAEAFGENFNFWCLFFPSFFVLRRWRPFKATLEPSR